MKGEHIDGVIDVSNDPVIGSSSYKLGRVQRISRIAYFKVGIAYGYRVNGGWVCQDACHRKDEPNLKGCHGVQSHPFNLD